MLQKFVENTDIDFNMTCNQLCHSIDTIFFLNRTLIQQKSDFELRLSTKNK